MKNIIYSILILLGACTGSPKKTKASTQSPPEVVIPDSLIGKDLEGEDILIGAVSLIQLEHFSGSWLNEEKEFYKTDGEKIKKLQPLLESGYPVDDLNIIALDENKFTPEGLEKKDEVFYVPTLILFDEEGQEMNRIVEFPIESLEADMLKILTGEPYKNAYAE